MSAPITAISIGGASVALDAVEWSVNVTHGRQNIAASPQPSTATITILAKTPDTMPTYSPGDQVTVDAYTTARRFTGTLTGMTATHQGAPAGVNPLTRITVTAVGALQLLTALTDGGAGFPEQALDTRLTTILDGTGLTYTLNVDETSTLLALDAAASPLLPGPSTETVIALLSDLCETAGCTMADLPDGNLLYQSYSRRAYDYFPGTWGMQSGDYTAQDGAYQGYRVPITLPPASVRWSPTWSKRIDNVLNDVTVSYGSADPQLVATSTDAASITEYGTRSVYLETRFRDLVDAQARADNIITAQSQARWNLNSVDVLMDTLDAPTLALVLAIESGDRIDLADLPQPAPDDTYYGVVEGWTEMYSPAGHILTLALSDPRYSYAMAEWADVSGALAWTGVAPALAWYDAVLPADLVA